MGRRDGIIAAALAIALVMSGCARGGGAARDGAPPAEGALQLSYATVPAPQAFSRDGAAVADDPEGAAGLWAIVPGLPRPERGLVVNVATGVGSEAALLGGRGGPGGAFRLSGALALAIGVGDQPARVRVTALRREPRIVPP